MMNLRWNPRLHARTSIGWLVMLALIIATVGCGDPTDNTDTQSQPLFVDFDREYEAPDTEYFVSDGISAVDMDNENRVPLIIYDDVHKFSEHALENVDVEDDVLRFPRQGFEDLDNIRPGDKVISELRNAEFWRVVNRVEMTDDEIVVYASEAELDDVVEMGDFHLSVQPGYAVPDDFDMLDPYLNEDIDHFHQTLGEDCMWEEVESLDDDESWYVSRQSDYNSKESSHHNWLDGFKSQVDEEHEDVFDDANDSCTSELDWNGSSERSSYESEFSNYLSSLNPDLDEDESHPAPPTPPSVVCFDHYLYDELHDAAEDAYDTAAQETGDDNPDPTTPQLCEALETGTGAEQPEDVDGATDEMSDWLTTLFKEHLVPDLPEFGAEVKDPACMEQCLNEIDIASCQDDCPAFQICGEHADEDSDEFETSKPWGVVEGSGSHDYDINACFTLSEVSVSYSPSFDFTLSLKPWDTELAIEIDGEFKFELGADLTVTAELNWDYIRDLTIPIPSLAFQLGPLEFGLFAFAEFGLELGFDAAAAMHVHYDRTYLAGAKVGTDGPSAPSGRNEYLQKIDDNFNFKTSGHIGANFNAFAGVGVGLYGVDAGITDEINSDNLAENSVDPGDIGTRYFGVQPLRGVFNAEATISPPACPYDIGIYLAGLIDWDLDFGLFSLEDDRYLYKDEPTYLWRQQGQLNDVSPFDFLDTLCGQMPETPAFDGEQTGCSDDTQCAAGERCIAETCVESEGLRMTLSWASPLDLNLFVQPPNSATQPYSVPSGNDEPFTEWNCGGICEGGETRDYYVENAVIEDPQPGNYRFYVVENSELADQALTDQNEVDYTIDLEHEGETTQELGGTLQRDHDEMPITYTYCVPNASGDNC